MPALSACSRFQQGLEVAIKLLGHGIDLIVAKLAESGGRSIIFEGDRASSILAQQHADGRVETRR